MNTTIILGAGFSKNSNIPVLSEIPEYLINDNEGTFETMVSEVLEDFMRDIFGYSKGHGLPNLDDIFTCIDISTNSGHHLGLKYSPLELRAVRRFLVYRVYSVIEKSFIYSENVARMISTILKCSEDTSFVVLNWDTTLEKYLFKIGYMHSIDYCCGGIPLQRNTSYEQSINIPVIKVHGSCNWLYCDNCRNLFYDLFEDVPLIKRAGFINEDFKLFEGKGNRNDYNPEKHLESCRICGNRISSHIATFSYRKSFRANSFPSIWNIAEKQLSSSDKWVFVGYSLPDSDYEFKHLMKIAELKLQHKRNEKLKIDVVLLNSDNTVEKYDRFFGTNINIICNEGIDEYVGYLNTQNKGSC